MPLFSHRNPEPASQPPPPAPEPTSQGRSGSIFRRSREEPAAPPNIPPAQQNSSSTPFGSIFGGRRSSIERDNASIASTNSGSVLHRGRNSPPNQDPTIRAARQKVFDAEHAERAADEALLQARSAVREARDHVKVLEREAEAESVLPLIKCMIETHSIISLLEPREQGPNKQSCKMSVSLLKG